MTDNVLEYTTLSQITWTKWLLRLGIAFVYGYLAAEMYFLPAGFLKYIPQLMQRTIPMDIFLLTVAVFHAFLVLWFISGWHTEYPAIISIFLMIGIIIPNLEFFDVLFRNVAIAAASLALAILDWKHHYTAHIPPRIAPLPRYPTH